MRVPPCFAISLNGTIMIPHSAPQFKGSCQFFNTEIASFRDFRAEQKETAEQERAAADAVYSKKLTYSVWMNR
jgi:hypothetical protein